MVRKYLSYIIFGVILLGVIGLAVYHSSHIRSLVDAMNGSDPRAQEAAALELIQGEQFIDTMTGETVPSRLKSLESLEVLANDSKMVKGTEKDAPDYRALAVRQCLAMLKDTDKTVRARAILALKRVGISSPNNLKELVAGLKDGDTYVRKGTVAALTDPQDGIGPKTDEGQKIDVIQAVVDLMKAEAGARGPGGDVLSSPTFNQGEARDKSARLLIAQLADKDGAVRQGAADALGKLGDKSAVEPLKTASVQDADPQVRRIAVGAIALIADPSGEEALIKAIDEPDTDPEARSQSAAGLGKIAGLGTTDSARAIATLIKALDDDDLKLRSAAIAALARAGHPTANDPVVSALIAALKSQGEGARTGAAQALQSIAAPQANSALITVMQNDKYDDDARAASASALGFPNNASAVGPLIEALSDPAINTAARDALTKIGTPAIASLTTVIQGKSSRSGAEPYYAAQSLAAMGSAALSALQQVAQSNNPVGQHWAAVALGGLGKSGVQEAVPTLKILAKNADPDVAYVANEQLTQLGNRTPAQNP